MIFQKKIESSHKFGSSKNRVGDLSSSSIIVKIVQFMDFRSFYKFDRENHKNSLCHRPTNCLYVQNLELFHSLFYILFMCHLHICIWHRCEKKSWMGERLKYDVYLNPRSVSLQKIVNVTYLVWGRIGYFLE